MLALSVAVAAALARTKAMPGGGIRKDAKYANTHCAKMYKAYIFDAQTRKIRRYSLRGDVKCVHFRYVKTQGASVAHIVNTSVAWFALGQNTCIYPSICCLYVCPSICYSRNSRST